MLRERVWTDGGRRSYVQWVSVAVTWKRCSRNLVVRMDANLLSTRTRLVDFDAAQRVVTATACHVVESIEEELCEAENNKRLRQ